MDSAGEKDQGADQQKKLERILADTKRRLARFPIESEERISTLDKPLIIESACPGWQPRMWGPPEIYHRLPPGYKEGGVRYPAVPVSIEDQVREDIEAVKAGAIVLHHHPREPETGVMASGNSRTVPLMTEIFDRVLQEVDVVTLQHTTKKNPETGEIDYITHTEELLARGQGNKYCELVYLLFTGAYEKADNRKAAEPTRKGVEWLEAHKIKPVFQVYEPSHLLHLKHLLIDTGVSRWKPPIISVSFGKHESHTIHKDPWAALQMITNLNIVRETLPGSIISIHTGGRNWLPMAILGIMLGVDIIRVGIEDTYWMWPHRDEVIAKNSDTVKIAVSIANILGRRVVTDAKEARQILGIGADRKD